MSACTSQWTSVKHPVSCDASHDWFCKSLVCAGWFCKEYRSMKHVTQLVTHQWNIH
jgi:hypothetical protein